MVFTHWENNFSWNSAQEIFSIHQKAKTGYKALFFPWPQYLERDSEKFNTPERDVAIKHSMEFKTMSDLLRAQVLLCFSLQEKLWPLN